MDPARLVLDLAVADPAPYRLTLAALAAAWAELPAELRARLGDAPAPHPLAVEAVLRYLAELPEA